jgi:prepilin-type processing-associated H-X9-DG protein/prepilin-type N-terminal cleavage/methylation domain-containing protein
MAASGFVRKERGAFTLIELLVVIAIIVILGSLTLPYLSRAKESGRRVKCMSNLHNLGLSTMNYSMDYSDHFPPYIYGGYTNYITGSGKKAQTTSGWAINPTNSNNSISVIVNGSQYYVPQAYLCPTDEDDPNSVFVYSINGKKKKSGVAGGWYKNHALTSLDGKDFSTSYAYNFYLFVGQFRVRDVPDPGRVVTFFDGDPTSFYDPVNQGNMWYDYLDTNASHTNQPLQDIFLYDLLIMRHSEKANAVFVDGHAERIDWFKLNMIDPEAP